MSYGDFIYGSASQSAIKTLDPIQNQSLRLATGVFRTTPIPTLQCLASTPPLHLVRQLSLLKFYSSSMYKPHSRTTLNLFNIHKPNQQFPQNSIPQRISVLLSLHNLSPPKYDYPLQPTFPPWLSPIPYIDLSMRQYNKADTPISFLNKIFLQTVATKYPKHTLFYTDGSKSDRGVGAAFTSSTISRKFRLPHYASIFTAELLAIKEATRFALTTNSKLILIISDSLSALSSIKTRNLSYNYIRQILDLLYTAKLKQRTISFFWLPSHIGNQGNDRADKLAKFAIDNGIPYMAENYYSDFNSHLKSIHNSLFQLQWDLENPNNKLWPFKSLVSPPLHSTNLNRKENVILRRLAAGHTFSTHCHLLKGEQDPICPGCGAILTVSHIFVANHLKDSRLKHNLPSTINNIINIFTESKNEFCEYLKEIHFKA